MPVARYSAYIAPTLLAATIAACTLDDSKAEDPISILGCYTAPDAPAFRLTLKGMQIDGASTLLPFRYEFHKIGYVLDVAIAADEKAGHLTFSPGERHFYRMIAADTGPTFLVAFGPSAKLVSYRRSSKTNCF